MASRRRGAQLSLGPGCFARFPSRVDRISALPDDLLLQVLTRLRCVRTAARTGLLARRWRRVWTGLLEVSFRKLAADAIHAALAQLTHTSLEAIDIHVSRGSGRRRALDVGSVTNLLYAAARRSPVKIALTIPVFLYDEDDMVDLPRFDFATSIELTVRDVPFALPVAMEFPALETLSLSGCIMDLAALVPRCPLLQTLSLSGCIIDLATLSRCPLLQTLSLSGCIMDLDTLVPCCPLLQTLSLSDCIVDLATLVPCCPLLRSLSVTGVPAEVDTITVHSASLQELILSTFQFTSTIDIVAPVLRKLTLDLSRGIDHSLSVVAPMVEEVTWRCSYYSIYVGIGKMWRVGSLKVRALEKMELTDDNDDEGTGSHQPRRAHVLSLDILETPRSSQRDFARELEKIPVTTFSVLELKIATWNHVLGPLLLNLFQICTAVQRLDIVLVDTRVQVSPCQENNRSWRKTAISLMDFTEVQIKGFKGDNEEINFLKLLFRCAPMLKTMTLKLSDEVTDDWYNVFLDTVQEYPYVNSSVYIG